MVNYFKGETFVFSFWRTSAHMAAAITPLANAITHWWVLPPIIAPTANKKRTVNNEAKILDAVFMV